MISLSILLIFNVRNQILIYIPDWLITHCPLKSLHELVHDSARDNHHPRPLKAELGWSRKTSETAAHESCNDLTCVSGLIFYRTCTTSYNATYGMRDVDMCNVYNSHVAALPFTTTCAWLNHRRCHSWELWRELTFSDTQICACIWYVCFILLYHPATLYKGRMPNFFPAPFPKTIACTTHCTTNITISHGPCSQTLMS